MREAWLARREESGAVVLQRSVLFEVVVTVKGRFVDGSRSDMRARASPTVVLAPVERERVRGSPRPAKEVTRMLMIESGVASAMAVMSQLRVVRCGCMWAKNEMGNLEIHLHGCESCDAWHQYLTVLLRRNSTFHIDSDSLLSDVRSCIARSSCTTTRESLLSVLKCRLS